MNNLMEGILPKQPFIENHEIVGSLSVGENVVDNLHICFQYSLIKGGRITGKILGTNETYGQLTKLQDIPHQYCKLSFINESGKYFVASEKASIPCIHGRHPKCKDTTYIVADIELQDVSITNIWGEEVSSPKKRIMEYSLLGPETMWNINEKRKRSYTGEIQLELKDPTIKLTEKEPFVVSVRPTYLYDHTNDVNKYEIIARIVTLQFETKEPIETLPNDRFISLTKGYAEDMIWLLSFACRKRMAWFRYDFLSDGAKTTYIRESKDILEKDIDWYDYVVFPYKGREYIMSALPKLRAMRSEGIDLTMPLLYCISGNEPNTLETKFSLYFLSLERIKDMYSKKMSMDKNMPNKDFDKLEPLLKEVVKGNVEDVNIIARILKKMPELNRPAIRDVLDCVFEEYKVQWTDMYPLESDFTLLKTRDMLFHSSEEIDIENLAKEMYRLRSIIERVLLAMIGWTDNSYSPESGIKRWLVSNVHST